MSDLTRRPGSGLSRSARERRAYQLVLVGGTAAVVAVGMDGQEYRLGEVTLVAGGTAGLDAQNVRPLAILAPAAAGDRNATRDSGR